MRHLRRLLIIPAALLIMLGGPVLAVESTAPPPAISDEVAVAPEGQTVAEGWTSTATPVDANVVGVSWDGDPAAEFAIEAQHADGTWSKPAEVDGDGDGQAEAGTQDAKAAAADPSRATDPIWIGDDATAVRVTVTDGSATNVAVETVDASAADPPSGSAGAFTSWLPVVDGPERFLFAAALFFIAAALIAMAFGWSPWRALTRRKVFALFAASAVALSACRLPPAANGTIQPNIIPRSAWAARPFGTGPVPCSAPENAVNGLKFSVVHHSAGSNSYTPAQSASIMRGMQSYHMNANGYCDLAYNFAIDKYGQIFEGRAGGIDQPVIGGHAGGFNTGSVGVVLIGDFTSLKPTDAQWKALVHLLRWRLSVGRVDPAAGAWHAVGSSPCNCQNWPVGAIVFLPNAILFHRDVDQTACAGNAWYSELGTLRSQVQAGIVIPPTTTTSTSTTTTSGASLTASSTTTTTTTAPAVP